MAVELEISESAYRKIEINQTKLSLEKFLQIAKILKVPVGELLGEKPANREYHQHNNDKSQGTFGTFIEHYYQDNKELTQKLINSLESKITHLDGEVQFLRGQIEGGRYRRDGERYRVHGDLMRSLIPYAPRVAANT